MVAPVATPFSTVILAVALAPLPVTLLNLTSGNTNPPDTGVSPIPALMIFKVPVAIPALET